MFLSRAFTSRVKILTLCACQFLVGCSFIQSFYQETCNSHAHVRTVLHDYINKRYDEGAPVRLGIIPFSVPANLAARSNELPGLGNELAWKTRDEMLRAGEIKITEVLNRQDWPGKKEEYYTGNYGALALGRETGYDLIMVGMVEGLRSLDTLTVHTKILEVPTGITIWSGKSTMHTDRAAYEKEGDRWYVETRRPDQLNFGLLTDQMANCIVKSVLVEEPVPF